MVSSPQSPDVPQLPELEGVLNFREMGGLAGDGGTIRHGAIYRSGHLATATDEDLDKLAGLDIGSIVDFRLAADRAGDGGDDRVPARVELVELPMTDPGGRGAEIREVLMSGDAQRMQDLYGGGRAHQLAIEGAVSQAIDPVKHEVYGAFVQHVSAADRPILFHCSAGKDRAGWAATVVGMALGVAREDLVDHYLLSNVHRPPGERAAYYESRGVDVSLLMPFLGVHEDYIAGALDAVSAQWGSHERYLAEALGVSDDQQLRLRSKYLVRPA